MKKDYYCKKRNAARIYYLCITVLMYEVWTLCSIMKITELTARWLQESLGVFNEETLELYRGLLDNHVIPAFGDRETGLSGWMIPLTIRLRPVEN